MSGLHAEAGHARTLSMPRARARPSPQLVPAVTELLVAELLYLEKQGHTLPIEMLINSSGTTRQDGEIVSACTQPAFACLLPAPP